MSETAPRYFTNSELGTMRRCPRKWYLAEFKKLYRPHEIVNEATYTGNLVHFGLEEMYNTGGNQDPRASITLMAATDTAAQEEMGRASDNDSIKAIIEENIATIAKCEELALIMVQGYVEWLEEEGEDSFLDFLSAEEEISVSFPAELPKPGAHLLAKLDTRILDKRSGARVFMDHKTVQNFLDREKWAHLDPQILFYSLIEYLYTLEGPDAEWTDGGMLNMLKKVKRTSRAKPPFYKRITVRHSILELQNYFIRVAGEITRIQQAEIALDNGVDHKLICPPSPTRDCAWDCQFFQACGIMDDGSDIDMYMEATFEVGDPLRRYETVNRND